MLLDVLADYEDLIIDVRTDRFRRLGIGHELRATARFKDNSLLHIRDYVFTDGTRKYAYHWQSASGRLRRRWDNAGHWPTIASHPHHVHIGRTGRVEPSSIRDIRGAVAAIAERMRRRA